MRRVAIVIENGKAREVVYVTDRVTDPNVANVGLRLQSWLAAAVRTSLDRTVCKSFTVGVHLDGPDCDHEVMP